MRASLPTNPYGQSKLLVEQMLAWFNRIHGLRYASLRYFNVAGAPEGKDGVTRGEAHEPESHLIPLVLDVALGRRPSIRIYGDDYPTPDGTCVRDYIHVSDLADAHLLALSALDAPEKQGPLIYNFGNGTGLQRPRGHRVGPPRDRPSHSGGGLSPARRAIAAVLVASSQKAIRELGWKPRYTELDEIVRTAWLWHQKRYSIRGNAQGRCLCGASICFRPGEPSRRSTPSRAASWRIAPPSWTAICGCSAFPTAEIHTIHLMNKDSLEMTDADRAEVRDRVAELLPEGAPIVISHGTDTMVETGLFLEKSFPDLKVPIILTGAMTPLGFEGSDGLQNLTESLLAARLLSPGVFVVMHGQVFPIGRVRKDKDKATFVWT